MTGSVGCAVPLLVISFLSHEERGLAVALLILSVALQNLTSVAYRINSLDIAPRSVCIMMMIVRMMAMVVVMVVAVQNLTSVAYRINSLDIAPRSVCIMMVLVMKMAMVVVMVVAVLNLTSVAYRINSLDIAPSQCDS